MRQTLTNDYTKNIQILNNILRVDKSFDIIAKPMEFADKKSTIYFVDGFVKDDVMEKIMEYIMSIKVTDLQNVKSTQSFSDKFISYVEADITDECEKIVTAVLSGTVALVIEGYNESVLIDARTYPSRGVQEPDDDRVLRGARDGFVETLVFNTALIRRRIRDPRLTMEITQVGSKSKTDVIICYMEGIADPKVINLVKEKIKSITIGSLAMSQESLAECLMKSQWYNPFPRARYTERPDAASASVLEGKIIIVVDNSPAVMILPVSLFDFTQDANDFYFPPLVGTYLRLVRTAVFLLTLFLTPLWYLVLQNPQYMPSWLEFLQVKEMNKVPIIVQLLIIEFVIDGLKLASLNTPSVLSNSFSVVGALILGDFAVQARWFVPEVVLYMAFVTIANFTQPSFELGYAFKLSRVVLLILTAIFNIWGFIAGVVGLLILIATTKTITGRNYLFPFYPFNGEAIVRLFIRKPINSKNT